MARKELQQANYPLLCCTASPPLTKGKKVTNVVIVLAGILVSASVGARIFLIPHFARYARITTKSPDEPKWEEVVKKYATITILDILADLWAFGLLVLLISTL